MTGPTSRRRAWVRSKVHTNTGRLCSAGSGCRPVPRRPRSYAALRLPQSRRPRPPVVPCRRPTLAQGAGSTEGLPGCWAVLFQRAVVVDPVGCASLLAHHAETAVAFRLHEALGTQHERYFGAAMPTAHSLACLRIGDRVAARAARLATGVGGLTLHRTGFAPVGRQTKFRESPHHHSPSTSLAWSHHAPTPFDVDTEAQYLTLVSPSVPVPEVGVPEGVP